MERAAHSRDDWTLLRVTTPDRPGGLAVFARCMAACGVDILSIEILGHEGPKAVADVLVHGGDLDRALRALDEDLDLLGRRSHGELPDPALAMAEACGLVYADRSVGALLTRRCGWSAPTWARSTGSTDGALGPGRADDRRPRVARRAEPGAPRGGLRRGRRRLGDGDAAGRGAAARAGGRAGQTFPFQAAEVDRLDALGRLALPVI